MAAAVTATHASVTATPAGPASTAVGPAPVPVPVPAAAAAPLPIREDCVHKNRLQEFAQRTLKELPAYRTEIEGQQHLLQFKSTVTVGGQQFSSSRSFGRRKEAEQDAARVAYEIILGRQKASGGVSEMLHLINEDVVFSKSILHEYSVKARTTRPSYTIVKPEGGPYALFVASVLFDGNTYTGEVATNKKDAEQKAARAAIKTILATNNDCMLEIIRSKEKLITAITSSGYNKERGFVIQESQPALTNVPPPIKFTPPVAYTEYAATPDASLQPLPQAQIQNNGAKLFPVVPSSRPTDTMSGSLPECSKNTVQGNFMLSAADPSAQTVVSSRKKRKKNRNGGPQAKEAKTT